MRKLILLCIAVLAVGTMVAMAQEEEAVVCTTIQDGTMVNTAGDLLETGYDVWGYNYQAHMFNGTYCDAYRDANWCQAWRDVELIMKWNDAWLSNEDCTGDLLLDRFYGHDSYIGSGAWTTNHQSGVYLDDRGKRCRWTYFVKIVAVPSDALQDAGVWYDSSGDEIGPVIWGSFAIVQQVENDPCGGQTGLSYKGSRPALGNWESDPNALAVEAQ